METKKPSWNHRKSFQTKLWGPRLCGSDDKRRGAFCAPKTKRLGIEFLFGFFSRFGLWPGRQVSVKLQAGHWGMVMKVEMWLNNFFWRSKIYINIIINRKIRLEVQATVQWFLMWGFFSPKSQANRLSPLVFLQDDDIWGSPDTAEARAMKGVGTA